MKLLRSEAPAGVSSTLPLTSRSARSFTAAPPPLHLAPPTFTLRPAQTFTIKKEVLSCPNPNSSPSPWTSPSPSSTWSST
nr:MAG TPA: hypothetical protein [Caudoviricetes sp.]